MVHCLFDACTSSSRYANWCAVPQRASSRPGSRPAVPRYKTGILYLILATQCLGTRVLCQLLQGPRLTRSDKELPSTTHLPEWLILATHPELQELSFQPVEPNTLGYSDINYCGQGLQPPASQLQEYRVDSKHKFLITIGTQKGGTTFLYKALSRHPSFIGSTRGRKGSKLQKEVHFFDRPRTLFAAGDLLSPSDQDGLGWYMRQWPGEYWNMSNEARTRSVDFAFHDATPAYLDSIVAPARVKEMVPHARFVLLLRDPVARAYSQFRMDFNHNCRRFKAFLDGKQCDEIEFAHFARHMLGRISAEVKDGCWFDEHQDKQATWGTCRACDFPIDVSTATHVHLMLHRGEYAAQLGWWLAFFPPERFLILTSHELQDPVTKVKALNKVIEHVGLINVPPFTEEMVKDVHGFVGSEGTANHDEELADVVRALRLRFSKSLKDLATLVSYYWPNCTYNGLPEEV